MRCSITPVPWLLLSKRRVIWVQHGRPEDDSLKHGPRLGGAETLQKGPWGSALPRALLPSQASPGQLPARFQTQEDGTPGGAGGWARRRACRRAPPPPWGCPGCCPASNTPARRCRAGSPPARSCLHNTPAAQLQGGRLAWARGRSGWATSNHGWQAQMLAAFRWLGELRRPGLRSHLGH